MSQTTFIKQIVMSGLENDQEGLRTSLIRLIEHFKNIKKNNVALELHSILKEAQTKQSINKTSNQRADIFQFQGSLKNINEFIIETLHSKYNLDNLVSDSKTREALQYFIEEQKQIDLLKNFELPVSNKLLLHGPSGCGKTLSAYVIAGELNKPLVVLNIGAVVSSKLEETSKNLTRVFQRAASEKCILFMDEFDGLGKLRDYNQDHAEMKRVVNTLLQLFDYLPSNVTFLAATNFIEAIDSALLRRFDTKIELPLPRDHEIKELIKKTLQSDLFKLDKQINLNKISKLAEGLSYFSIQRSLLNTIKRNLILSENKNSKDITRVDTKLWMDLIEKEKVENDI